MITLNIKIKSAIRRLLQVLLLGNKTIRLLLLGFLLIIRLLDS